MLQIKIGESLHELLKGYIFEIGREENLLCLASANDEGVLVDALAYEKNVCRANHYSAFTHSVYLRMCKESKKNIPTCYILVSYNKTIGPKNLDKNIMFFWLDAATGKFSIYNDKSEFEPIRVTTIYSQKEIQISKKLYNSIQKHKEIYNLNSLELYNNPRVYLLAKDNNNIIVKMEELTTHEGVGCSEMLHINVNSIHEAYIKIIKQGLIPCGYISFTSKNPSRRSFHHLFESTELFINVPVHSQYIKLYDVDSIGIHRIEFKIAEV